MDTNHQLDDHKKEPRNTDVAYEKSDLSARGILTFFVILLLSGVVFHLVVWGMYDGFIKLSDRMEPPVSPMAVQHTPAQPSPLQNTRVNVEQFPAPRLQVNEPQDETAFRLNEEKVLNEKPWEDKSGVVHIPIEEAMKILVQRGLPSRPGITESDYKNPMVVPTDSGFVGFADTQKVDDATAVNAATSPSANTPADGQTNDSKQSSELATPGSLKKK